MGGCAEQSGEVVVVVVVVTRLMRLPAAQHVTRDTVTLLIPDTHTRGCDVEKRGLVTID